MQIFITVLILILMLGILVSAHEAGHLLMCKAFNVYCLEYSIGFGPRLFSKTKKGGETAYSLRALPLGGYVSMLTEEGGLPDGRHVPMERTVSGISGIKQAFIFSAGILVNLFLSLLFVFVFALAIPSFDTCQYVDTGYDENGQVITEANTAGVSGYALWAKGTATSNNQDYVFSETTRIYSPFVFSLADDNGESYYFVLDAEASSATTHYVACLHMSSISQNDFKTALVLFTPKEGYYPTALRKSIGLTSYPDLSKGVIDLSAGMNLNLRLNVLQATDEASTPDRAAFQNASKIAIASTYTSGAWSGFSLNAYQREYYLPFAKRMAIGCANYTNFFKAIGAGFAEIFSGNLSNIGSVVAVGKTINTESQNIGLWRTFFIYGGFLSLSFALLNLFPFPGLDGWQLLVVLIEKGFRKKIPAKVKNVVSLVGLGLLMAFSIYIIGRDIVGLFLAGWGA